MTEWNASDYDHQSTLQETMAQEHLRHLTFKGTERILDIGCGDGRITATIAQRVAQGSVLGVDPSKDMIDYAGRHHQLANLRFEVADARQLPFRSEFDLVISFNALHWVPEQAQALQSIHAVLKPTGRAMLRMVSQGSRQSLEDVIEEVRQLPRWAAFFAGYVKPYIHLTPVAYRALAGQCGFRVVKLNVTDHAWDFKTHDAFLAFCRATFVEWTKRLPENEWPEFINYILDRYRTVAASNLQEAKTFKFYQMQIELEMQH